MKRKKLLNIVVEIAPDDVQGSRLMFEDSFVSFFPEQPKEEARYDLPERVENGAAVRTFGPMSQNAGYVPLRFASLTSKENLVPELAS